MPPGDAYLFRQKILGDENSYHQERDTQFCGYSNDDAEPCRETDFAGLNRILPGDEFARRGADERTEYEADESEK